METSECNLAKWRRAEVSRKPVRSRQDTYQIPIFAGAVDACQRQALADIELSEGELEED